MGAARTSFELRIETIVGPAVLATFRVPLRPTAVPRSSVYRFRIPADRDLTEVLQRLIERDVELLEIRRRPEPRRSRRPAVPDGVVVPLRTATEIPPVGAGAEPPEEPVPGGNPAVHAPRTMPNGDSGRRLPPRRSLEPGRRGT
jgi:hypothetical protein